MFVLSRVIVHSTRKLSTLFRFIKTIIFNAKSQKKSKLKLNPINLSKVKLLPRQPEHPSDPGKTMAVSQAEDENFRSGKM